MARADELKRWIKDRLSRDEDITVHPTKALQMVEQALPDLSATERQRNLDHVKAYADLYYQGRHDVEVPNEIRGIIDSLAKRAERLNVVDTAREIVVKLGGPPSRQTIQESLQRSGQARNAEKTLEPAQRRSELQEISQRVLGTEAQRDLGRLPEGRIIPEQEYARGAQDGYRHATDLLREQLANQATSLQAEWKRDLLDERPGPSSDEIDIYYQAQFKQINQTYAGLRRANPEITNSVDTDRIRREVYTSVDKEFIARESKEFAARATDYGYVEYLPAQAASSPSQQAARGSEIVNQPGQQATQETREELRREQQELGMSL
jgi:hypothetical protein